MRSLGKMVATGSPQDMPGLVVKDTKNKRETPEESELGRWGPESGPPAAGSVLTGKRRIMGLESGHALQVQLSDSRYTQGFRLSSHHVST